MYRLGIDVGGTNTDAVLLNENLELVASVKRPTSADIQTGITQSIAALLTDANVNPNHITHAMLGTTQCTNAIVECSRLARVCIIRLGYPATAAIQPFTAWPQGLVDAIKTEVILVEGGYEYDGKVLTEFNEEKMRLLIKGLKGKIEAIAIIGVFSSIKDDQELKVEQIVREELGDSISISLSSQISSGGFIERENATILNSALANVISLCIDGFQSALRDQGVQAEKLYLCQNDGTLMSLTYAKKFPILTIACGVTNSIRGAAYLENCQNALVLDVGGTTADVGVLAGGSPRESSMAVEVGGIVTNFRMPDVVSIGLGGGSIVREVNGKITIGPDSVGYRILQDALVFGGNTLTTTDIAVRLGMADIGDATKVAHIDRAFAQQTMDIISEKIAETIDKMKLSSDDVEVIVVGGGAVIVPTKIMGVSRLLRPAQSAVANAIGASIAQVSGVYEKLYLLDEISREEAIHDATLLAKQRAILAGSQKENLQVMEIDETPLAYHPGNTIRLRVKVIGDLLPLSP